MLPRQYLLSNIKNIMSKIKDTCYLSLVYLSNVFVQIISSYKYKVSYKHEERLRHESLSNRFEKRIETIFFCISVKRGVEAQSHLATALPSWSSRSYSAQ